MRRIKATPHKDRLEALHVICLQIFLYLAQNLFDIRQYVCIDFVQSNEKSDFASDAQSLCGIALMLKFKEGRCRNTGLSVSPSVS